jgi:hypothetical protein
MKLMLRVGVAFGLTGALVLLSPSSASAVRAGAFCATAAVGTYTTGDSGESLLCAADNARQNRWTTVAAPAATTTTAKPPSVVAAAAAIETVTMSPAVAPGSTTTSLATTGLHHTRQFVQLALVCLGIGTALVLETRARDGLDRLRRL